jgi:hypothetical protein
MGKLYCKRTCFYESTGLPKFWDKRVKWKKNKIYNTMGVNPLEDTIIDIYIETETDNYYAPTFKKELNMYFMTVEENRDKKINDILNDTNNKQVE